MDISFLHIAYIIGSIPTKTVDKKPAKATTPKKPVWTEKDKMACKIQTAYRGYRCVASPKSNLVNNILQYMLCRCRKMLLELKRKQVEYDQLMDKLQKEVN